MQKIAWDITWDNLGAEHRDRSNRRRAVPRISLIGGLSAAWTFAAHAQQPSQPRRIDLLMLYPENDPQGELRARAFEHELEKAGWTVGGDLQINYHWGTGDSDWVRSAIAQIVGQAPDVVLANGDAAVKAAQQATQTLPVIFIASGDPVGDGFGHCFRLKITNGGRFRPAKTLGLLFT
jgi:ABC transporter substrate binding protein